MYVLMLWLLGCPSDLTVGELPHEDGPSPILYQLIPATVSFGEPALGETVSEPLEIFNLGDQELVLEDVALPEGIDVSMATMPVILPGANTSLLFTWTPDDMALLNEDVVIVLGDGAQTRTATVPVKGGARGGYLTASTQEYDFGDLAIGCQEDFAITYTNTGNEPLTIDEITVSGSDTFQMAGLEFPLVLDPFESRQLEVTFKPSLPEEAGVLIELEGDDDVYAFSSLTGTGTADGENEIVWTTEESGGKMTVIFHVHGWFIPGNWSEGYGHGMWTTYFEENLDHFFDVLQKNGANYRMAFIWNVDGKVRGREDYLDRSFTPSESKSIVLEEMLDGGESTDIDQTWPLYIAAVKNNRDWLFENESWTDSKLSFVVITRDQEQSGMHWATAMSTLQSNKDDPDEVTFSAISGPPPMGCDGVVEYPLNMREAIAASGGLILSACETDWTSNWEKLAAHTMNGSVYFSLEGTVVVESIKVYVDGQRMTYGWSWEADYNAVVFDDGYYPLAGSSVRVTYLLGGECE